MQYEIIDFHTHPFFENKDNICNHKAFLSMNADTGRELFRTLGISKICGSVISVEPLKEGESIWDRIKENNDTALKLREYYQGFYVPGFHIHPDYIQESIAELERMAKLNVKLMGELVPYIHHYKGFTQKGMDELIECATAHGMVINVHTGADEEDMDEMVKRHPKTTFVAAHPGEYRTFLRHVQRAKLSENYCVDVSGSGMFRFGLLRRLLDELGADRVLFGSDYPTCNPAMFVGAVALDTLITEEEKKKVFSENAKRLLYF